MRTSGYSRNVEVHWLIAFAVGAMFHKTGISPFDLNATSCFLLDMLDVGASMTHYLCSQVEAWDGLQIDGYPFFRPFALQSSLGSRVHGGVVGDTHTAKLISLNLVRLSTSESPLVD